MEYNGLGMSNWTMGMMQEATKRRARYGWHGGGLMLLLALAGGAQADEPDHFSHKDWMLVCDNTRTCRAAGYSPEGEVHAASVLLTRQAGPKTVVSGQLRLGDFTEEDQAWMAALPKQVPVALWIDGKRVGGVLLDSEQPAADLPAPLTHALLAALRRDSRIEWRSGKFLWPLSGAGATAVLLKMDEMQGRVGTPGALVRRGQRAEAAVLPPLPAPVVVAAPVPKAAGKVLAPAQARAMRSRLRASLGKEAACDALTSTDDQMDAEDGSVTVWPLSSTLQLVELRCWLAVYNAGHGYWVVGEATPPVQVTDSGSEYDGEGTLVATQKGRGIADCLWNDTWTWDGRTFVHSDSSGDGMCRMVSAGGAWSLPTWVTALRQRTHGETGKPVPAQRTR